MTTARPFAYNTGQTINGTQKLGNLAIGVPVAGFSSTGLNWRNGPDEDLGYVISRTVPSGNQPAPDFLPAYVGFWRTSASTDNAFIQLTNSLFGQSFTTGGDCKNYLINNGYWTSWGAYKYYRWQITEAKIMPPNSNCVQSAEFEFQLSGVSQPMSSTTVSNPSGSNPVGETPPKLVDSNLLTKWLDLNFVSNGNVSNFIFEFPTKILFNGYRWATANDEEGRDPKSWTIAGSNDGSNWTTLHTVTGFVSTTNRNTWQTAQTY